MSALQAELPRLLGASAAWSLAPFGAASLGLAVGTGLGAKILSPLGPRLAATLGTLAWGFGMAASGLAVANGSLAAAAAGFVFGGAGVGLAYLTIVATVGPSFPTRPLIGSAIGPVGFMIGTSLFFLVAMATGFHQLGVREVGTVLIAAGLLISCVAVAAGRGMPRSATSGEGQRALPAQQTSAAPARRALSVLLFVNALPGMLLLAVVVPVVSNTLQRSNVAAEAIVVATAVALFLGGLLAPGLRRRTGVRKAFVILLLVRGALLLTVPLIPGTAANVLLLAAVLFGHGAGFSLLPGLMRSQDSPARFHVNYGQVLIAWGVAGLVGVGLAAVSVSTTGGYSAGLAMCGGTVLTAALLLAIFGADLPALRET
ncbi:hypothetical protein [Paenarthrobacter sp. NPDC089316]|uniref:hypothetical protein n=1 Tax=unclassified Paenarthrobacter TaxID=2634190 RepID=UPI003441026A